MLGGYYGCIRIADGLESHNVQIAGDIIINGLDGTKLIIETDGNLIRGHKYIRAGKLLEHERLGEFYKGLRTFKFHPVKGKVLLRYHQNSKRSLHGMCARYDQKLFGFAGKCVSRYSRGRFVSQEFRYLNRKLAFKLHNKDRQVVIKRPNGKVLASIDCPGGFSANVANRSYYDGRSWRDPKHSCNSGELYFFFDHKKKYSNAAENRRFDFSKDGNCKFVFYDGYGRVQTSGEYKNGQRVGEWLIDGKPFCLLNGIPVSKRLYDTPAEKLKISTVLKLKNAQLRAAMIKRIGSERLAKECKYTIIHQDKKKNMKLMEFPIAVDDGNGSTKSKMRILQVKCPSTHGLYFLQVPDFVWDSGKMTKLNTCESARQWTFGIDNPRKKIVFEKET
jgi:hypothetical protein